MRGRRCRGYGRVFLMAMLILSGCGQRGQEQEVLQEVTQEEVNRTEEESVESEEASAEEPEVIYVYVCGEVHSPGVYVLEAGSRVCDGLEAAGGMTDTAAETYLNQAQILTDGEKIYVPSEEEAEQMEADKQQDMSTQESGKVSINHADKEALMTLTGIGESKAEAIIAYREANGGFSSLEELMQVDGIKEGTYNKIKEAISL